MPLLDDLLAPIPGANPAGTSLRYNPVYDKIKEARREELDLPQGGWQTAVKTADWPLVIKLATECLTKQTKDLQIAAWLTEAKLRREGFAGLREGLELIRRLIEEYWETLYPELEDGDPELRAAPLEWIGHYLETAVKAVPLNRAGHSFIDFTVSRTVGYEEEVQSDASRRAAREEALAAGKVSPEEFDQAVEATPKSWYKDLMADLDGALEAVEALDRVAEEKFEDEAPSFLRLRQALQEVRQAVTPILAKKLQAEPDPVEEAPAAAEAALLTEGGDAAAPAGGAAAPGRAAGVSAISISAIPGSREEAAARIAAAASYLRAEQPTNPAPYLLLRGFRWGELHGDGDGVDPTLLVAPPTEVRSRLKGLLLEERWAELREAAEEVMAQPYGRGWLDLQRYALTACEALGSEYDAVAAALRSAIRTLLSDLPELSSAALMDDSPAANAETQKWLRDEGLIGEAAVAADDELAVAARPRVRRDPLDRAIEQVRNGEPAKAIELLMREAAQEASPRASFLRKLQAAKIMVDAGYETVATPLLQEMLQQIESHSLEQWEAGETIAQPLVLMYHCMKKVEDTSEMESLFLRVSRLDPLQAIQLSNSADNGE